MVISSVIYSPSVISSPSAASSAASASSTAAPIIFIISLWSQKRRHVEKVNENGEEF